MPMRKLHIEMDIFTTGELGNMTPDDTFEILQGIIENHGNILVDSGKAVPIGPQIQRTKAG